jgi:two-component system response regulator RegA
MVAQMSLDGTSFSVLVVDDDVLFARAILRHLRMAGWEAEHVEDGADALRRLGERDFDAMLLDLQMQNVSGLGVLEGMSSVSRPPVTLLLSGHLDIPTTVLAMRAGVVDVLEKPTDADEIDARLRAAVIERQQDEATETGSERPPSSPPIGGKVREVERTMILDTFRACGGNLSRAARELGLPRTTLRDKLRRYARD